MIRRIGDKQCKDDREDKSIPGEGDNGVCVRGTFPSPVTPRGHKHRCDQWDQKENPDDREERLITEGNRCAGPGDDCESDKERYIHPNNGAHDDVHAEDHRGARPERIDECTHESAVAVPHTERLGGECG